MDNTTLEVLKKAKNKIEILEKENINLRENLKTVISENKFVLSEIQGMENELKLLEKEKNKVAYEKEKNKVDQKIYNEQKIEYEKYKQEIMLLEEKVKILNLDKQELLKKEDSKEDIEKLKEIIRALIENQESIENQRIENSLNKSFQNMEKLEDIVKTLQREKEEIRKNIFENKNILESILKTQEKKFHEIKKIGKKEKYKQEYFEDDYNEGMINLNKDNYFKEVEAKNNSQYLDNHLKIEDEVEALKREISLAENKKYDDMHNFQTSKSTDQVGEKYLDFSKVSKEPKSAIELKIEQLKKENEQLNLEQIKLRNEIENQIY